MKRLYCSSDIGSCLIGNKDWTFAVPNMGGDGTTKIAISDNYRKNSEEFFEYEKKHDLQFISSVQGTFHIYSYDCAYRDCKDEDVIATLSGRYAVYRGYMEVVFVKWE